MLHRPHDFLRALTDEAVYFPRSFELHALLYRLCEAHAGTLDTCLREGAWEGFAAQVNHRVWRSRARFRQSWLAETRKVLESFLEADTERLLVGSAAVLEALDTHHRGMGPQLDRKSFELPSRLGGGQTVFLPPPENLIAERVPRSRRLGRRQGHQRHVLREILELWWLLVAVESLPEKPRFVILDATPSDRLRSRWERAGDLRVGLASPFADLDYEFRSDPGRRNERKGTPYRFVSLKAEHLREARAAIDRILEDCAAGSVDLLCFPELTLDNDLLGHLRRRLQTGDPGRQPALTVTGSFHLSHDTDWVNRCHVLDERGRICFVQDKCKPFEVTPELAREMGDDLCLKLGIDDRGGFEEARCSKEVTIADCALGRLATPICLDFCGKELVPLFAASQTNLFLVPAMTPRMRDFRERARDLGTDCRGSAFVVNSAWLLRQHGEPRDQDLFFGYVPAKGTNPGPDKVSEELAVFSIRILLEGT